MIPKSTFTMIVALLLLVSSVSGIQEPRGPETTERPGTSLQSALTGYVYWMERVSRLFERQPVETMNMEAIEEEGAEVNDILIHAIAAKEKEMNIVLDREQLSESLMKSLEDDFKNMKTDTVIGLVLANSIISSQGARMKVASRLFAKVTVKMQRAIREYNESPRFLKRVYKYMSAAEIALETMVTTFHLVEDIALKELAPRRRQKRSVCTGLPSGPRQGGINLGGGFSTDGSSVMFNQGQTTVNVKPHFQIVPRPELHGGTASFEHRFNNLPGSISGHVHIDGQGNVQSAGVGVKIEF